MTTTVAPLASPAVDTRKYVLCDWEINGYDDSDFMLVYFDAATNTLHEMMHGTTRFGSCTCDVGGFHVHGSAEHPAEPLHFPTPAVVEAARLALARLAFGLLEREDKRQRDTPHHKELTVGMLVTTTANVRNQASSETPCDKCEGSGKWINPRNAADERQCFACKGRGLCRGEKVRDANGKLAWHSYAAGTTGEVLSVRVFGRRYQWDTDPKQVSVCIRTAEGKVFTASLDKVRLARAYKSTEQLQAKADELSYTYNWPVGLQAKCAWLTRNFAAEVVKAKGAA